MPSPARGAVNEDRIPVSEKSRTPPIRKPRQFLLQVIPAGTFSSWQTTVNSALVRVTDENTPELAQGGGSSSGSRRHIAMRPGRRKSSKRLSTGILFSSACLDAAVSCRQPTVLLRFFILLGRLLDHLGEINNRSLDFLDRLGQLLDRFDLFPGALISPLAHDKIRDA